MLVLKSVLAGLLALLGAAVILWALLFIILPILKPGISVGFDPVSFVRSPGLWLIAIVILAASYWQFRRLSRSSTVK